MSANLPIISIVTPTFNQGSFIRETIDSVLSQDYPRIEYLVVDGGSVDNTLDILQSYGDRLRWISEPDEGQSAAINKGWRMSQGEIIAWLNSDDTYLPGAIRQIVDFLQEHPEIEAVYGDCDYVDVAGRFVQPYPTQSYSYLELVSQTVNYIPQPATFIRRRILKSIGDLDESLHQVMDLDYWLRLGVCHTMAYLPVRLATLRLHPTAKSLRGLGHFASELVPIYRKLFSRSDLPLAIRAIESLSMSNIYYRASTCAFWAGYFQEARRYALRGWRYAPFNLRTPLLFVLLGRIALRVMERWRGNPFLLGLTH